MEYSVSMHGLISYFSLPSRQKREERQVDKRWVKKTEEKTEVSSYLHIPFYLIFSFSSILLRNCFSFVLHSLLVLVFFVNIFLFFPIISSVLLCRKHRSRSRSRSPLDKTKKPKKSRHRRDSNASSESDSDNDSSAGEKRKRKHKKHKKHKKAKKSSKRWLTNFACYAFSKLTFIRVFYCYRDWGDNEEAKRPFPP